MFVGPKMVVNIYVEYYSFYFVCKYKNQIFYHTTVSEMHNS